MASLTLELRHQRRAHLSDEWVNPEMFGPARLQPGEEIRLDFSSGETLALYRRLEEWYALCSGGIESGERTLSVVDEDDVTVLRGHERDVLRTMMSQGKDFWELLESIEPDLFTAASIARLHQERLNAVNDFKRHLDAADWDERDWQDFFERETWIFGHGLAYQFLDVVTGQPAYGGIGVDRRGLEIGDFLLATDAAARFTVLVEIKRPDTALVGRPYRGTVHELGKDLIGGVAQIQAATRTWTLEGSRAEANRQLLDQGIETVLPKSILVAGNTAQLSDAAMRRTFELFRRNLLTPEVLTFDELYARAEYMVNSTMGTDGRRADAERDIDLDALDDLPF